MYPVFPGGGFISTEIWRRKLRPEGLTLNRGRAEELSFQVVQFLFLFEFLVLATSTRVMDGRTLV